MVGGLQEFDLAFVSLIAFFLFFVGLVFYLRREDRREGYPLEDDTSGRADNPGAYIFIPEPKAFALAHGRGAVTAPNMRRDTRELAARRTSVVPGSPIEPTGNPLVDGVGPAAWAERARVPDLTAHGDPKIVPMRVATDFKIVAEDPDPRGMTVVGADGAAAGTVSDVWVDRPESMIRYLEVQLAAGGRKVLLPMTMALVKKRKNTVVVDAITAAQFANVPATEKPDQVTFYEEERICAYYGGGHLYAMPSRSEPLI
ncbi:MAG: photosynthetic reaction center subunit H [Rhodospirillaceae bacterium]|nr:photosynthetic reaction center subunit H [Rhodospirillaceae bacterium]